MDTSLYVGLSRQVALERSFDIVAHNIANAGTVAYRGESTLFDQSMEKAGLSDPVSFVIDKASFLDVRQGNLDETGNPLDLAIMGEGWLSVDAPQGVLHSRDGRMAISRDGVLVTRIGGLPILDINEAPIAIDPEGGPIQIAKDGMISQKLGEFEQQIGQIGLVQFPEDQSLTRAADGLYAAVAPPQPALQSTLIQGSLEQSNVQPILEMVRMMDISRAFQQATEFIENGDELKREAISRLGRRS
ncbi:MULTISPECIES: flagellar hook-basal body complex protein [unclassified Iodidimonas]|jgi:flagellar basal-body rod protein FlgF|uniref:flagellar hook-basal body complex protein n=1 Tax=unclassified Iodidimonas TaxID=2626145 RepID=UPI00248295E5|nr:MULTISPECIES: flagellar hook-basal body complex protein [unclassified Iodidimonas]